MFLVFLLGFGVASSLNLGHPEGLHFDGDGEYASSYEDYKPRDYKFEYGVSDPHTGDHKSHWEVRENGVVRGEYSLLEPDGTTRVVQYTADDHGFRAVVKKLGHAVHPPQHQSDLHNTPIIIPEIHGDKLEQPYFKSYDGNAENYINALDDSNLISLLSDNHQILENAAHNAHIQEPITLQHSGTVADHHSYPSYESESITKNQETYSHEFSPKLNDHQVPTQQESLHIAEPIFYHQPIQRIQSEHQPIHYSYGSFPSQDAIVEANKQQPIQYQYPAYIQEPIQEHVDSVYKPNEIESTIGVKIVHPHGESSSSFIGSTGNAEDDSAYTRHDKRLLVSGVQDYQGWNAHDRPIPYQYLQKREVTGTHEKKMQSNLKK